MPEHDSVDVPLLAVLDSVTVVGEELHVRPTGGETVVDNETVPTRP